MVDRFSNFIAGEWREGCDWIENVNPSDVSDFIGLYAQGRESDVDDAVAAACQAQRIWARTGVQARRDILDAIGCELIDRSQELGRLLSREEGKTLAEGIGEVYRSGQFFQYFAALSLQNFGESGASVRHDIEVDVQREPVGIVAVISPWNFPIATASWKIAPALAYGNAVVWKPANLTPASAWALAEIIARHHVPAGLFNLVMGNGGTIGEALARHRGITAVTFTGSHPVGMRVAQAAVPQMTRVQLEMGAKNALVIMDDADLDLAVSAAMVGAFSGTGQKCTASPRLIVHRAIHDRFLVRMIDAMAQLTVDHALKPGSQMGPVVSAEQLTLNLEEVGRAVEEGGQLVAGGTVLERESRGHYMAPTLFAETTNDMRVNRVELFAPIACVIEVDDYDQAVDIANDTDFGLTAGIVTRSLARAKDFRKRSMTGCVMVNLPTPGTDYHVPFSGRRNSSYGPPEQGAYAAQFYTATKTTYIGA